jgi:hypothetical protein
MADVDCGVALQAALDYLLGCSDVDPAGIVLLGKSLGGAVAFYLAQRNKDKVCEGAGLAGCPAACKGWLCEGSACVMAVNITADPAGRAGESPWLSFGAKQAFHTSRYPRGWMLMPRHLGACNSEGKSGSARGSSTPAAP